MSFFSCFIHGPLERKDIFYRYENGKTVPHCRICLKDYDDKKIPIVTEPKIEQEKKGRR